MSLIDVDRVVLSAVLQLAARKRPELTEVAPSQKLIGDLGLDSLDIAELVAVLELELGQDPFATTDSIADVRTAGDLIAVYRRCSRVP